MDHNIALNAHKPNKTKSAPVHIGLKNTPLKSYKSKYKTPDKNMKRRLDSRAKLSTVRQVNKDIRRLEGLEENKDKLEDILEDKTKHEDKIEDKTTTDKTSSKSESCLCVSVFTIYFAISVF